MAKKLAPTDMLLMPVVKRAIMKNYYLYILFLLAISFNTSLFAQDSEEDAVEVSTVEQLLMLVKKVKQKNNQKIQREAKFMAEKNNQAAISCRKRELARQERIADQLEAEYKKNEDILRVKEEAYQKELGSLVELFGHLQSSAGSCGSILESLTSPQYGIERVKFLNELTAKMSETTELPTIREIEGLWFELQREMAASGQVVSFETSVIDVDGETTTCNVTRVGLFNAVCDGKYLEYVSSGEYAFYQDSLQEDSLKLLKILAEPKLVKKLGLVLILLALLEEAF